ncbi:unnamed protein product [Brassicogethes aeneus]|uniref:aralkylamine N-acetyltransferase n=1 Tax=Brassicogethes aeneus TaxID=1431903 RepID=A0A9P0FL92_BRAAE|nr:unnamed protein product [Brassicogethes aeneus]
MNANVPKMVIRKQVENIIYQVVPKYLYEDVICQMQRGLKDEPLNTSVGYCDTEILEKKMSATLYEGYSIMALDTDNGEIAGVVLNGIEKKEDVETALDKFKHVENEKYQKIFKLIYEVNESLDIHSKYNLNTIFKINFICVNPKYRRRGLVKELLNRCELLAIEKGFKLMKLDCTSNFVHKVAELNAFASAKTVRYGDFTDGNGKQIYDFKMPHDSFTVMIKLLDEKASYQCALQ